MDCLTLLASCIEEAGSAIAPALADPAERRQLERLQEIGAFFDPVRSGERAKLSSITAGLPYR